MSKRVHEDVSDDNTEAGKGMKRQRHRSNSAFYAPSADDDDGSNSDDYYRDRRTLALREIRRHFRDPVIRPMQFQRLVREFVVDVLLKPDIRFQKGAMDYLLESTTSFLVGVFEDANLVALHDRRITVIPSDIRRAQVIRGDRGAANHELSSNNSIKGSDLRQDENEELSSDDSVEGNDLRQDEEKS